MKIDTSRIEGYSEMSAEEKLAALENLEMSDVVPKATADKYASEAASYKKQLREKQTAEEAAQATRDEERTQMLNELAELRRGRNIDRGVSQLLGIQFESELATKMATALVDGDMESVFKCISEFSVAREKAIRADLLRDMPQPPPGNGSKAMTRERWDAMNLMEKAVFATEHPEEYKNLHGG